MRIPVALGLDAIAVFVKVVEAGSFRGAARILGMPNTTVSANVARLELRLGVTLIQRTTRKLRVTAAGQAYFDRCLRGLAEIETAELEASCAAPEPRGLLRIAATVSVAHTFLPSLVARYRDAYPRCRIELLVANRMVDLLVEGIDLAVRPAERLDDSTVVARRFVQTRGGLWASPAYLCERGTPRTLADLEQHRLLVDSHLGRVLRLSDGRDCVETGAKSDLCSDDQETLRAFALEDGGIAPLLDYVARPFAREGLLSRVLPGWTWFDGKLALLYPAQAFVPANVRAFIDLAVAEMAQPDATHQPLSLPNVPHVSLVAGV